jgi:hypothetical protein
MIVSGLPWDVNRSLSACRLWGPPVAARYAAADESSDGRSWARQDRNGISDVHPGGIATGHVLLQVGRHRDLRRDQVHFAVDERRQQHFARQRQEDDVDLVAVVGAEVFVEPCLYKLAVLVRDAAWHSFVDVIERAIERHPDPHEPSLDKRVEVLGKRRQHRRAHRSRQLGFEGGGREWSLGIDYRCLRRRRLVAAAGRECYHGANEQSPRCTLHKRKPTPEDGHRQFQARDRELAYFARTRSSTKRIAVITSCGSVF